MKLMHIKSTSVNSGYLQCSTVCYYLDRRWSDESNAVEK